MEAKTQRESSRELPFTKARVFAIWLSEVTDPSLNLLDVVEQQPPRRFLC